MEPIKNVQNNPLEGETIKPAPNPYEVSTGNSHVIEPFDTSKEPTPSTEDSVLNNVEVFNPDAFKTQPDIATNDPGVTSIKPIVDTNSIYPNVGQFDHQNIDEPKMEKQSKKRAKPAIAILVIIALLVGAYFIYTHFNPTSPINIIGDKATNIINGANDNSVVSSDLVVQKDDDIDYLRPKSWVLINGTVGGYKSKSGNTDTSTNYLVVYASDTDKTLINLPESQLELQRQHPKTTTLFDASAKDFLQRSGRKCTTDVQFNSIPDRNVMGEARGIYVNEASCDTSEGRVLLKQRTALRNDGRLLVAMIIAPEADWTKNDSSYQKILNSIE